MNLRIQSMLLFKRYESVICRNPRLYCGFTLKSFLSVFFLYKKSLLDVVQYKLSGVIYLNGTCVIAYSQVIVSNVKGSHVYNVVDPGTLLSCEEAEIYVGSCNAD